MMDTQTPGTDAAPATANVAAPAVAPAAPEASSTAAPAVPAASGEAPAAATPATPAAPDAAAPTDGTEAAAPEAPAGAPAEGYVDFTAPEGIALDPEVTSAFKELAKADNLPQEHAQKYVDLATSLFARHTQAATEAWAKQVQGWAAETKADPELGGARYEASVQVAHEAVSTFGSPALKTFLETYGLGNHPEFVRFCANIGKANGEAGFIHGKGNEQPGAEKKTLAKAFWGDDPTSANVKPS